MASEDRIVKSKTIPLSSDDFSQIFFRNLEKHGNSKALVEVWSSREITFAGLKLDSESVARHLVKIGIRKGDVVGIFAPNSIDWIVAFLGIIRIGGVVATFNCQLKGDELNHQLSICEPKALFTTSLLASNVLELSPAFKSQDVVIFDGSREGCILFDTMKEDSKDLPDIPTFELLGLSPSDPVLIAFSSGTTGAQKAVLLSHLNLESQRLIFTVDPSTKFVVPKQLIFAPLSHLYGLFITVFGLIDGSLSYFLERFELVSYLKLLQDLKIDNIIIVPPIAVLLAKSPEVDNFRLSLKLIRSAAAPLSEEVIKQLRIRFPGVIVLQGYGLTESSAGSCGFPLNENTSEMVQLKPQSVGIPPANVLMKIIDEKGTALGPNEKGEVCIKGPSIMLGYLGNPEATAAAIDKQGWLHTGDLGYYDNDGYFYLVDRLKELIKYKALQVAPAELEAVLLSHPLIADAGVIGRPDVVAGELPMAWVVKRVNVSLTEKDVEQFVADRVAPYKRLRGGIRFVESIPKSPTGKILRKVMREDLARGKL